MSLLQSFGIMSTLAEITSFREYHPKASYSCQLTLHACLEGLVLPSLLQGVIASLLLFPLHRLACVVVYGSV